MKSLVGAVVGSLGTLILIGLLGYIPVPHVSIQRGSPANAVSLSNSSMVYTTNYTMVGSNSLVSSIVPFYFTRVGPFSVVTWAAFNVTMGTSSGYIYSVENVPPIGYDYGPEYSTTGCATLIPCYQVNSSTTGGCGIYILVGNQPLEIRMSVPFTAGYIITIYGSSFTYFSA
jgi:hypothetical protein